MKVVVLAALAAIVGAATPAAADDLPVCPSDDIAAALKKLPAAVMVPEDQDPVEALNKALGCRPPQNFQPLKGISVTSPDGTPIGKTGDLLMSKEGTPQYLALTNPAGVDFGAVALGKIDLYSNAFSGDGDALPLYSGDIAAFNGNTVFLGSAGGGSGSSQPVTRYDSGGGGFADLFDKGLSPYKGEVFVRFRSSPPGAMIDVAGTPAGSTEARGWIEEGDLTTVDMQTDGYQLCTYAQGRFQPAPAGGTGTALFSCTLKKTK